MKSFCISVLFCCTVLVNFVMGEIKTTDDLEPIFRAIQEVDDQALVVFDVHDVLMIPTDQILRKPYKNRLREYLAEVASARGNEEASTLASVVKRQHGVGLVDPKMAHLVQVLQERRIATIAMTNAQTGLEDGGCSHEDLLLSRMNGLGIDFSGSFPFHDPISLECPNDSSTQRTPLFKNGVIFTCQLPKGPMLKAFLQRVGIKPSGVVFVDDKLTNLESVETFCREAGIPFFGFQYTAGVVHPPVQLHEKRAELQLMILQTEKRWVGDDEANQILNACL